jgi:hypothetical protein
MGRRELEKAASNLVPGHKTGQSGIIRTENNLDELATALAASTLDMNGEINAVLNNAKGQVVKRARSYFTAETLRPLERGEGQGGRRETTNFTFGAGGAFQTRTIKISDDERGFGFPDVATADTATNRVWRSLEFGLPGTKHGASQIHFAQMSQFFPHGTHILPRRFIFSSTVHAAAVLILNKGPKRDSREGGGFEGKHFIERAWFDAIEALTRDFKIVEANAFKAFKG